MTVPTLNLRPRQNFSTGMNLTTAIIRKWNSLPRLIGVFSSRCTQTVLGLWKHCFLWWGQTELRWDDGHFLLRKRLSSPVRESRKWCRRWRRRWKWVISSTRISLSQTDWWSIMAAAVQRAGQLQISSPKCWKCAHPAVCGWTRDETGYRKNVAYSRP